MASPPRTEATLHPGFRAPGEGPGQAIFGREMVFDSALPVCATAAACGPLGRLLPRAAAAQSSDPPKAVKRKKRGKSVESRLSGRSRAKAGGGRNQSPMFTDA